MLNALFEKLKNFLAKHFADDDPHFEMRRYVENLARKYRGRVIWDCDDSPDSRSSK